MTTPIEREALSDARRVADYEAGWNNCAIWAGREDLLSDTDSPAYLKERDALLAASSDARREVHAAMAQEYSDWIDFFHAGQGDYNDFLRIRLALAQPSTGQKT